jgi:hypothetical protein
MTIYSPYKIQAGVGLANAGTFGENTLSLNHFNGTDASTVLTDDITGITWTIGTGTELDTAVKKFGDSSLLFTALTTDTSVTGFNSSFTASNFTIEGWYRQDADEKLVIQSPTLNLSARVMNGDFLFNVKDSGANNIVNLTSGTLFSTNTHYHFAFVKNNTIYSIFFNENRIATGTATGTPAVATSLEFVNDNNANSWLDDFRLLRTARYSGASYTAPAAEFIID